MNTKDLEKLKREREILKEINSFNKKIEKSKKIKLDIKTKLFLHLNRNTIVGHIPVEEVIEKRRMYIRDMNKENVYIFKDYAEYMNFFRMYLEDVSEDVIDLAILTRGSKGQIIASKTLCERIIIKKRMNEFYSSITKEKIKEIHDKGKLTPLEMVQLLESLDLYVEGNKTVLCKNRCSFFDGNCHECLMESVSHKLEHDSLNLKLVNELEEQRPNKVLSQTK